MRLLSGRAEQLRPCAYPVSSHEIAETVGAEHRQQLRRRLVALNDGTTLPRAAGTGGQNVGHVSSTGRLAGHIHLREDGVHFDLLPNHKARPQIRLADIVSWGFG